MAQGAYFLDERFPSPLTHPYFPKASCGLLAIRGPHFRRGRFGKRRIPNTVQARFDTGRTRVFRSRRAFCTPNIFRCKSHECETPFHRGSNFFEPARFLRTGDSRETGGRDSAARQSQRAQDSFTPVRAYFGHRSIRPPFYPPCTPSRPRQRHGHRKRALSFPPVSVVFARPDTARVTISQAGATTEVRTPPRPGTLQSRSGLSPAL